VLAALMLNWVFGELDGTLKGYVKAIRLPDLHLPLLDTLFLLKKVQ
jgi:hypothetical protein